MSRSARAADLLLLGTILAVLLVWPLRFPPIGTHGEAREGLVVQDIVERGDWILPRRNGELPSKPPLFHWLAAPLAYVFGVSEVTLRLPSALAAGGMAATTFVLGVTLGGRTTGWLAVGALLGMFAFWQSACEARVDMLFAACVTLSLAGFHGWYRRGGDGARAVSYLAAAAAVLAKGPAGLLLPGLVIGAFLVWQRELGLVRRFWSWPLAGALATIDLGWYALASRSGGRDFLAVQLLYENVDRFLGRDKFARAAQDGGYRHFVLRMPLDFARHFFPWNLAVLAAGVRAARGGGEDASGRFLHAWWIVILAFFTLASGKRAVYLLPLAPAIALLAGRSLVAVLRRHAVATLLVTLAVFDLGTAAAVQLLRAYHARRESLVEFAEEAARIVPAGASLYAARGVEPPAVLVLAYRLDRPIVPAPATCSAGDFVLERADRAQREGRDEPLAESRRAHVVLVRRRCAADG